MHLPIWHFGHMSDVFVLRSSCNFGISISLELECVVCVGYYVVGPDQYSSYYFDRGNTAPAKLRLQKSY